METMLAARYLAPHRIEAVEVPVPQIEPDEVLIRVDACGFCGSDIGIVSGVHPRATAPLTLGHEFCGHLAAVGTNSSHAIKAGDFVTVYPLLSCGVCLSCRTEQSHVCRNLKLYGFDRDGGMAGYVKVAAGNVIPLPAGMPVHIGALIEPLAVAVHGVSRAPATEVNTALIIGAGPIGLLTALVAQARGLTRLLISDINPSRLALARHLGLKAYAPGDALKQAVDEATGAEGVDCLFECAGSSASAQEMTALVRPRGTIVNLSVFKQPVPIDMQAINFKELTLVGSRVYTRDDFVRSVELAWDLPLDSIITHHFSVANVTEAFANFQKGEGVCKIIVVPGSETPS